MRPILKAAVRQNLRTDDNYLVALSKLAIEVPFDSIIGNLLGTSVKPTTDGVSREPWALVSTLG